MSSRHTHALSPLIGYHGCERQLVEDILAHRTELLHSANDWDWLGKGVYFWVDGPERAARWAQEQKDRGKIKNPAVLGAYINPGLCLNLTDVGVAEQLGVAFEFLRESTKSSGAEMPVNSGIRDGIHLNRKLDCAVFNTVHQVRAKINEPPFDSVYGVFEEGGPMFEGSDLKEKTHIQIAVINLESIIGYFKPRL